MHDNREVSDIFCYLLIISENESGRSTAAHVPLTSDHARRPTQCIETANNADAFDRKIRQRTDLVPSAYCLLYPLLPAIPSIYQAARQDSDNIMLSV